MFAGNDSRFQSRCKVCRMPLIKDQESDKLYCPSCGWEAYIGSKQDKKQIPILIKIH